MELSFRMLVEIAKNWRESDDYVEQYYRAINWDEVYNLCRINKLLGHYYQYIKNRDVLRYIPKNNYNTLMVSLDKIEKRMKEKHEIFKEINNDFKKNNIKTTIIKGLSFSRFYPPGVRSFSDYDLLVNPNDMISVKRILEGRYGFRVDDIYYNFAKNEDKITDGTVNYLHAAYVSEKLMIEAHPATSYFSWVNTEMLHRNSILSDDLYLLTPVHCFLMAVAHVWNHNPQHLQHVSYGSCTLSLYVDVREIFIHLINRGYKQELYQTIIDNNHVEFSYEALKTCERLFAEKLIPEDFPTPKTFINRDFESKYLTIKLEDIIIKGQIELERIKDIYYSTIDKHQINFPIHKKIEGVDIFNPEVWDETMNISYNNYYVEGDYYWPRRTVNYFYQFYNVPIKTSFSMRWADEGLYLYGSSDWNPKADPDNLQFNFHHNYIRFMFGKKWEDIPVSILLQPKSKLYSSVFIGDGELKADNTSKCLSRTYFSDNRYTIISFIPWEILSLEYNTEFLFDIITHHQESDVPGMVVWSGGMGSEKMFLCDYFAKARLLDK